MALLASLTLCLCFLCTGCTDNGTYKLVNLKYITDDTTMTCMVGDKYQGMTLQEDTFLLIVDGDDVIFRTHFIETNKDGSIDEDTDVVIGKWIDGYNDEVYFYTDAFSSPIIAKRNGETVVVSYNSIDITLKK